ncbi:MAG TPA: FKBP-type peptidyl-prolyl cis-trans isomerase [Myxococcales bacterium]|jgi:FKBP-type peptidyl-prolyl cis-trans isomerase FkpA
MPIAIAVLAATLCAAAPAPAPAAASDLKTEDEKTLYAVGLIEGKRLSGFALSKAELEIVKRGLSDAVVGNKPAVELTVYGPKVEELYKSRAGAKATAEKGKGKEFTDKFAKEPGAQKLPSGVVYKELKAGTGPSPKATDTVKVHYLGTLIDGTKFDSSYDRNAPAEFPLNGVIKCWTEGVQKMKVGGKAKLVCPADTAYGDGGRPNIPGGATLVFEVELLEIKAGAAPAPAPAPGQGK